MSIVWFEGFRNQAFSQDLDPDYDISTPANVSQSVLSGRRPDCYALYLASESVERTIDIGSARKLIIGAALSDTYPALGTLIAIKSGGTVQASLCIDDDGLLHVYRGDHTGTLLASADAGTELSDAQTYYVELEIEIDGSGYAIVHVDDTEIINETGIDTEVNTNDLTGVMIKGQSAGYVADWYVVNAADTTYPYARLGSGVRCTVHEATAAFRSDWTPSSGSNVVSAVTGVPNGDTSYVSGSGGGATQQYVVESIGTVTEAIAARVSVTAKSIPGSGSERAYLSLSYGTFPRAYTNSVPASGYRRVHRTINGAATEERRTTLFTTAAEFDALSWGFALYLNPRGFNESRAFRARATQFCVQSLSIGSLIQDARVTGFGVHVLSSGADDVVRVTGFGVHVLSSGGVPEDLEAEMLQEVAIGSPRQWVAEITYATNTDGDTETLVASDGEPWATKTTDTPPDTYVYPRLAQPGHIERSIFDGTATFGAVRSSYGVCEVANNDGQLDSLASYTFSGHPFVLRAGRLGDDYPSQWSEILRATMQAAEFTLESVNIRLRDRIEMLDRARLRDPALPDPVVFGNVLSIEPVLIDEARLIYAVGRPPDGKLVVVQSLRDNGLPLTHASGGSGSSSSTIATEEAVESASVPTGRFNWHAGSGRLKLGIKPTGKLTCTLRVIDDDETWTENPAGNANVAVGTILSQMAEAAGIDSSDIDSRDVLALDIASGSTPYGYWDSGTTTVLQAMELISNSIGAYFGFDRLDRLRMAQFAQPTGTPVWTFTQHNMVRNSVRRITPSDVTRGVPVWRVVARSGHVDAPTDAWAGAVTEADKAALGPEWPVQTVAEDESVKLFAPTASELVLDVYSGGTGRQGGTAAAAAGDNGEAARRLSLYDEVTQMVQLEAPATALLLTTVDIGSTVELQFPRYGWDDGVLFVVVGMRPNIAERRCQFTLWRNGVGGEAPPPPE